MGNVHIHRAHALAVEIAEQNALIRQIIANGLVVLSSPPPDTFLGRKTQDPFPKEEEQIKTQMKVAARSPWPLA